MSAAQDGTRLTVFTTESALAPDGRPLHLALVERAQAEGLAGATVLRGVEGYGVSGHLLTTRFADLSLGLPLVIEIVDRDERIESFLPALRELAGDELVLRQPVAIDDPR